jgi:hypothetical protein
MNAPKGASNFTARIIRYASAAQMGQLNYFGLLQVCHYANGSSLFCCKALVMLNWRPPKDYPQGPN